MAFVAALSLVSSVLLLQPRGADAARDERTLSLYEIHTRETTTVTYKRDGKYIPEALKKLNWAMRDWRTSATTKMDPRLFDLVWELKQQLDFKKPIHVISGHRSAKTNKKLRRRGGGQAKKSQHVRGKAMDIHFPGVKMSRVRKLAFQLEIGGVGYYPTSALPFVHVDTARVRAWPRMGRTQLAMLFPHSHTKHRPARGGPLTSKDRKRARIRLAALARKTKTRILLANASMPRTGASPAQPKTLTIASLANDGYGTLEIPGLSRHAKRLWINKPGNTALSTIQSLKAEPTQTSAQKNLPDHPKATPPETRGQTFAKTTPRNNIALPKARLQLASLSPQDNPRAGADHNTKLWVNGAGLRATWLIDTEIASSWQKPQAAKEPKPGVLIPRDARMPQYQKQKPEQEQRQYDAERVAYAPAFDEEHPDELSYRPFQILPLMSAKPVAQNKELVAMVEPQYDRVFELLATSENIPMQFRPSSRDAETRWNNQFKGNAIINIRKQTQNTRQSASPQKVAQR